MKKVFFISLLTIFISSCCNSYTPDTGYGDNEDAQEFFNKRIRKHIIKDSEGHTLRFYETGIRGTRFYSFSIDHDIECQKCLGFFD